MPDLPDNVWLPPRSITYPRHLPVKDGSKTWQHIVAETGGRKGKAKYGPYPRINDQIVKTMEETVVTIPEHELPRPKENVRAFWGQYDQTIGAASGQETTYLYVEYLPDGTVHGRPMTKEQLIAKGMRP